MNGSWEVYLASHKDLARGGGGGGDGITNLAKEKESGIKIIERTP